MMDNKVKYAHYQLRLNSLSKQKKKKNTNLESVAINEAVNVPPQEIHINERLQSYSPT